MADDMDADDLALRELHGGVIPDEATVEAPRRWLVVAKVDDDGVAVVLTDSIDGYRDSPGPPVVVSVPADRVALVALQQALSVWQRDDGLYRFSPPVEALCDGLRQLNAMEDHTTAAAHCAQMVMDVAKWWTATRS